MTQYFRSREEHQKLLFSNSLFHILQKRMRYETPLVILCIGTDRVTGDSLGPYVGYRLSKSVKQFAFPYVKIYGTLKEPVHAMNLEDTLVKIKEDLKMNGYPVTEALILVVDASLGFANHLGYVTLSEGPLKPGEGVHKKLPRVGQVSITGIVGESRGSSKNCQRVLSHTRLYDLIPLSDFISEGLNLCLQQLYLHLCVTYDN